MLATLTRNITVGGQMSQWRVDPDGVLGILAGIDDLSPQFESAAQNIEGAATEGGAALTAGGRRTLADAWEAFMEDRRVVPGTVMYAVNDAARSVGEATVAVVTGDEQMATDTAAAERHAEDAWGIALPAAYGMTDAGNW